MIMTILSSLGLSEEEGKTYLALLDSGHQTAARIAQILGMPRPSVYGFLRRLCEKGAVAESQKGGVKVFVAEPPEKLGVLFEQMQERLEKQHMQFLSILPELAQRHGAKFMKPKFQLFEGEEGLKHVLKDMLLYKDIETLALWPIKTMIETLTPDFFRFLNKARIRQRLFTRAIWPHAQTVDIRQHPYLGIGKEFLREIRIAPERVNFSMGYWMYQHKTAFISSRRESFGFIIESAELSEMLRAQFEIVWEQSQPVVVRPQDTQVFLDELSHYH